jgi:hypothetical protein
MQAQSSGGSSVSVASLQADDVEASDLDGVGHVTFDACSAKRFSMRSIGSTVGVGGDIRVDGFCLIPGLDSAFEIDLSGAQVGGDVTVTRAEESGMCSL